MSGEDGLRAFLEEAALVQAADSLESAEAGAVTLITLHAAKGLEFPVVFIIGLEDGIAPHSRAIGPDGSMDQLQEERRLLYVGVTRAMQRLFLVYAAERTLYGERRDQMRSCFLDDVPPHLLTMSASQMSGGVRSGDRLLSQSRGGWDRGSSSRYGSRGRGGGSVPAGAGIVPAVEDAGPKRRGLAAGAGRHGTRTRTTISAWMPTIGRISGSRPRAGRCRRRAPAPPARPSGTNGRGRADAKAAAAREPRFSRGQRVKHLDYGTGTVIASSVVGSEELALVRFDSRPDKPKNLSLSIHRLEPA